MRKDPQRRRCNTRLDEVVVRNTCDSHDDLIQTSPLHLFSCELIGFQSHISYVCHREVGINEYQNAHFSHEMETLTIVKLAPVRPRPRGLSPSLSQPVFEYCKTKYFHDFT